MTAAEENQLSMVKNIATFFEDAAWTAPIATVPVLLNKIIALTHLHAPLEDSNERHTTTRASSILTLATKKPSFYTIYKTNRSIHD